MEREYAPELVIGFVAPSGTSFEEVSDATNARLALYAYATVPIRLSDFLWERTGLTGDEATKLDRRTPLLQREGDTIRREWARGDALALIASGLIRAERRKIDAVSDQTGLGFNPVGRSAFLVWSLKHPAEVQTLRNIYGSRFFLISAYAPRELRERRLAERIAESNGRVGEGKRFLLDARQIIDTDESEPDPTGEGYGQNVRGTYPLADFFVDASTDPSLRRTVARSIDVIFGDPFATPTRDEYAMFVAQAAALRSAELGRQVGSVVATRAGDIVATGTNEVPAAGGGHYWIDDPNDEREYRRRADTSDVMKDSLASQIVDAFSDRGWLSDSGQKIDGRKAMDALRDTRLRDLTEFGRAVHAEASALLDAAKRGTSVAGNTMYVTTFPCHQCTRHVVAAGIARLVYIYPYAKSLAEELHGDSVQTDNLSNLDRTKVPFEPFLGVAPRHYLAAFEARGRKDDFGKAAPIEDRSRIPVIAENDASGIWDQADYIERESVAQAIAGQCMERLGEQEDGADGRKDDARSASAPRQGSPRADATLAREDEAQSTPRVDGAFSRTEPEG